MTATTIATAAVLGMSTAASAAVPISLGLGDALPELAVVDRLTSEVVPQFTAQAALLPVDSILGPIPHIIPRRDRNEDNLEPARPDAEEEAPAEEVAAEPEPAPPVVEEEPVPAEVVAPAAVEEVEPAPVAAKAAPAPTPVRAPVRQAATFGGTSAPAPHAGEAGHPGAAPVEVPPEGEFVKRAEPVAPEPRYAVPAVSQQERSSALPTAFLAGLGVALVALYNLTSRLRWEMADRRDQRPARNRG